MLTRLYNWTMGLSAHPFAERWLAFIAFVESSFFPIPPDVMLVPMALADRVKAFRYAAICTIGSVIGAFFGYLIGYFLWETIGQQIIEFYGYADQFETFKLGFVEWGSWLVFVFGLTFFPFKVITIASGVMALDPITFGLASIASRTPRFFIEAALIWRFGDPIRRFIEKRLTMVVSITVLLTVGGFIAIKFL